MDERNFIENKTDSFKEVMNRKNGVHSKQFFFACYTMSVYLNKKAYSLATKLCSPRIPLHGAERLLRVLFLPFLANHKVHAVLGECAARRGSDNKLSSGELSGVS